MGLSPDPRPEKLSDEQLQNLLNDRKSRLQESARFTSNTQPDAITYEAIPHNPSVINLDVERRQSQLENGTGSPDVWQGRSLNLLAPLQYSDGKILEHGQISISGDGTVCISPNRDDRSGDIFIAKDGTLTAPRTQLDGIVVTEENKMAVREAVIRDLAQNGMRRVE